MVLAQMPVELLGQLVELGQQVAWVHMQQVPSVKVRNRRQSAASPRATDRHRVRASTSEHSLVVPRGDAEGALCSLTCADAADTPGLRERPGSELTAKHGAGTSSARDVADMMSPGSVSWTQTA